MQTLYEYLDERTGLVQTTYIGFAGFLNNF